MSLCLYVCADSVVKLECLPLDHWTSQGVPYTRWSCNITNSDTSYDVTDVTISCTNFQPTDTWNIFADTCSFPEFYRTLTKGQKGNFGFVQDARVVPTITVVSYTSLRPPSASPPVSPLRKVPSTLISPTLFPSTRTKSQPPSGADKPQPLSAPPLSPSQSHTTSPSCLPSISSTCRQVPSLLRPSLPQPQALFSQEQVTPFIAASEAELEAPPSPSLLLLRALPL